MRILVLVVVTPIGKLKLLAPVPLNDKTWLNCGKTQESPSNISGGVHWVTCIVSTTGFGALPLASAFAVYLTVKVPALLVSNGVLTSNGSPLTVTVTEPV